MLGRHSSSSAQQMVCEQAVAHVTGSVFSLSRFMVGVVFPIHVLGVLCMSFYCLICGLTAEVKS